MTQPAGRTWSTVSVARARQVGGLTLMELINNVYDHEDYNACVSRRFGKVVGQTLGNMVSST